MKKLLLIAIFALSFSNSATADIFQYNITNFTFDSAVSFVSDTSADYKMFFEVDTTPPTFDMPVSNFTVVKDGVDIGAQGFTSSTITMSPAGGGFLATDLNFDGSGSDFMTNGTLGITFTIGDGVQLQSFWGDVQSWNFGGFSGTAMAIPEPATAGLLGMGLIAGCMFRRRRQR